MLRLLVQIQESKNILKRVKKKLILTSAVDRSSRSELLNDLTEGVRPKIVQNFDHRLGIEQLQYLVNQA